MFEVLVLILLEILFVILFIFQDNEAILEINFNWKHYFSKNHYAEVLQGGVLLFP